MLDQLLKPERVVLDLKARTKEDVLKELVDVLDLPEDKKEILLVTLKKREAIGSTGMGKGIAIPHTRSLVVEDVHLVIGRSREGVEFDAIDGKPVHLFFLLVAPPQDPGTTYLLTLGRIANLARKLARTRDYLEIDDPREFVAYLTRLEQEEAQ
jgi:mannitol/fructose-specific phosphotransferase system IIA component (Ntr-type)